MRLVTLCDGTAMGDVIIVFNTDAPVEELMELERICCQIYIDGGDYEDIPIWANVLKEKGYVFDFVDSHQHITPFNSSDEWIKTEYVEITEHYVIENQPTL